MAPVPESPVEATVVKADIVKVSEAPPDAIALRDPWLAAFLTWLVPGLGHWYQGRKSKAILFFVCVGGTFAYGLHLGEGRVVYASWRAEDRRLPFLCQMGIGVPTVPALIQARRFKGNTPLWAEKVRREWADEESLRQAKFAAVGDESRLGEPVVAARAAELPRAASQARLWDWFLAPPLLRDQVVHLAGWREPPSDDPVADANAKPPRPRKSLGSIVADLYPDQSDELDKVQKRLHHFWELGTVYTMVAGLLNLLVMYDAFGGPAYSVQVPSRRREDDPPTS